MPELREMWGNMLRDTLRTVIDLTPRIIMVIAAVIVALLFAKLVERLLRAGLSRMRVDALVEKVGLDEALQRIGVRQTLDRLVPRIVYFLLLILFAKTAADAIGLIAVSQAIGSFMAYLPNLIAAILILVVGSAAAQWAGGVVADAAAGSGIEFAGSLGRLVSAVLLFVLGVMAVTQLRIDTDMVRLVSTAALAGMALAFGLSFGLGSRDITRNILAGFYARKTFRIGEEIEMRGERGRLRSITPTQTLIERDDELIAVSNSTYLEEVVRQ